MKVKKNIFFAILIVVGITLKAFTPYFNVLRHVILPCFLSHTQCGRSVKLCICHCAKKKGPHLNLLAWNMLSNIILLSEEYNRKLYKIWHFLKIPRFSQFWKLCTQGMFVSGLRDRNIYICLPFEQPVSNTFPKKPCQ